jgi:hypothetical protein
LHDCLNGTQLTGSEPPQPRRIGEADGFAPASAGVVVIDRPDGTWMVRYGDLGNPFPTANWREVRVGYRGEDM